VPVGRRREYPESETLTLKSLASVRMLYGGLRVAVVVVLCLFTTADDLTDVISGSLRNAIPPASQVRAGTLSEDDRDDIHHGPVATIGHFVTDTNYSPALLNEFVTISDPDVSAVLPRWVASGRAPPAVC
jgi:hypothetical protein